MLEGQHEPHPDAPPAYSDVDALGLCPYSEETVAGCRYYHPVSAHSDFPEAGHCTDAVVISGSDPIRYTICCRSATASTTKRAAMANAGADTNWSAGHHNQL